MRHSWSISDSPDLPILAFHKALGKNRPATLEGGKGGSAPQAPDPWTVAQATTAQNQATAAYNKALNLNNYSNPFGSQSSSIVGTDPSTGAPIYNTQVSANPQIQGLFGNLMGQVGATPSSSGYISDLGAVGKEYTALNNALSGLGGSLNTQAATDAQRAGQDAAYQAQSQYLNPQFVQREQSLQAQLAAQGLAPGSQAYSNAMLNFGNERQRAYSDAANQAIMTGSQLGTQNWQNQLAGIAAQSGLMGQRAQNLGATSGLTGQMAGLSQLPYQNLQSIASMIPGYTGVGQAATNPADIAGAMNNQYQGQLGAYNARQQSANATTSSLAGLAGIAAMAFF